MAEYKKVWVIVQQTFTNEQMCKKKLLLFNENLAKTKKKREIESNQRSLRSCSAKPADSLPNKARQDL